MKIVFIGAGSVVFSRNIIADLLWNDAIRDIEIVLADIDPERLRVARAMSERIRTQLGARVVLRGTRDYRKALDGADVVINAIGVGGIEATRVDLRVPARFGITQTVGDTLGVGGIFRAMRSVPELLAICRAIEIRCPNALLLNYSNPMAMHCLAVQRATSVRCVGLCHGVQGTARHMRLLTVLMQESRTALRRHFKRPAHDPRRIREWLAWWEQADDPHLDYLMAGINHMAFALRFNSEDRDLYPLLREAMDVPEIRRFDPVRFELFRRIGFFMTETSRHAAEYVPYFLKNPAERERLFLKPNSYLDTCKAQARQYQKLRRTLSSDRPVIEIPYKPSIEYAAPIVRALGTGIPYRFNGNVHNANERLLPDLPGDCCVEVPCTADAHGIHPIPVGTLPPVCAALIRTNINVQDLAVRGILEGNLEAIRHALMLDPNTAATLTLPQIDKLLETMIGAARAWLPKQFLS